MRRESIFWLIIIFSLCFKISLAFYVIRNNPAGVWVGDSTSYWNPALSILKNNTFSVSPKISGIPETIRTPGYPFFLFLIMKFLSNNVFAVIFIQILMSLFVLFFTYMIGKFLFDSKAGVLAVGFLALDLTSIASCNVILTETLFDFLLITGVLLVLQYIGSKKESGKSNCYLFTACCFLSVATLVRPVLYFFIPVLLCFCFIFAVKQKNGAKQITLTIMVAVIPAILIVGGWQYRNWSLTGDSAISSIQGKSFLYYRAAGVNAMKEGISIENARNDLRDNFFKKYPEAVYASAAAVSRFETKEGISILLKNPIVYAKVHLRGTINMMLNPGSFRVLNLLGFGFQKKNEMTLHDRYFKLGFFQFLVYLLKNQTFLLMSLALSGLMLSFLYFFASVGIIISKKELLSAPHIFILLMIAYLLVISGGPEAHDRFREPIIPLLCVYAGYGARPVFLRLLGNKTRPDT